MKYIRTEDDIFDTSKEYRGKYIHDGIVENIDGIETTINQANTIEELCDELVIIGEFGNYLVEPEELDKHAMGQTKEMLENGMLQCYGAIWTEWGLKYVAKMNDKGELELL